MTTPKNVDSTTIIPPDESPLVAILRRLCPYDAEFHAMTAFMDTTGCTEVSDLTLLHESDVRKGLAKTIWQEKVLLLQAYLRAGGAIDDNAMPSVAEMQQHVMASTKSNADNTAEVIQLNVGGQLFTTTSKTLCRVSNTFFDSLLRDALPLAKWRTAPLSLIVMGVNLRTFSITCAWVQCRCPRRGKIATSCSPMPTFMACHAWSSNCSVPKWT